MLGTLRAPRTVFSPPPPPHFTSAPLRLCLPRASSLPPLPVSGGGTRRAKRRHSRALTESSSVGSCSPSHCSTARTGISLLAEWAAKAHHRKRRCLGLTSSIRLATSPGFGCTSNSSCSAARNEALSQRREKPVGTYSTQAAQHTLDHTHTHTAHTRAHNTHSTSTYITHRHIDSTHTEDRETKGSAVLAARGRSTTRT